MEKKSDIVRRLVGEGNYQKALSIAKSFKLGITKDQHNAMLRAYECMVHPDFYKSIGANLGEDIKAGVSVLVSLYG